MAAKEWEQNEIDFIIKNYQFLSNAEIGNALGRSKDAIHKKLYLINQEITDPTKRYERSEEQKSNIRSRISGNRFKLGVKPWNAGTKGVKKANSGSFKAGNKNSPTTLYDKPSPRRPTKKRARNTR